jgi:serine protease Do
LVHQSVVDLERYGAPQRGWLGASLISLDQLDPLLLAKLGLYSSQGAMINKIVPGGPAALAGLRAAQRTPDGKLVAMGDVILAVGGHPVANAEQVIQLIAQYRPGDRVPLIIWRSGRRIEVIVTMIARRG